MLFGGRGTWGEGGGGGGRLQDVEERGRFRQDVTTFYYGLSFNRGLALVKLKRKEGNMHLWVVHANFESSIEV